MSLPGRCVGCGASVVWTRRAWYEDGRKHKCPEDRATCGAFMPLARERCARRPGHSYEHRSRYCLDNNLRMKTGRAA